MIFKKKKKKQFTLCKCVHHQRPSFVVSHHAGKDGSSSRVVRVGKVRRGVECRGGAHGEDVMAVGSQ